MSSPSGRVVAELGRPETPQETADRKARDRAVRRSRQTFRNLVASIAACLAVVGFIALFVPRGDAPQPAAIDARTAAAQLAATAGHPLVAPVLPTTWRANAAELRGAGADAYWYVGYVVGGSGFAALAEGLPGSTATIDGVLDGASATGTTTIGGLPWRVYDQRSKGSDAGNAAYGLATRIGEVVVVVWGTPSAADVRSLAAAVASDAAARGLTGTAALP